VVESSTTYSLSDSIEMVTLHYSETSRVVMPGILKNKVLINSYGDEAKFSFVGMPGFITFDESSKTLIINPMS
jgi:hypothetical protein